MKRDAFLPVAAVGGGGLLLQLEAPALAARNVDHAANSAVPLNAWVRISPDNVVTIMVSQAEMGQGIGTTHPMVIAEELDADWDAVQLEKTGVDPSYANPYVNTQFTGDARSIRDFWPVLRTMGAAARDALVRAAAAEWNVDPATCRTAKSTVTHLASGRSATYGSLAAAAAALPVNQKPALKSPARWTLLRTAHRRVDLRAKITGEPVFGIDVVVPHMAYAAVKTAPTINGDVLSFDDRAVRRMRGVLGVVRVPRGVAVVATSWWRAHKAVDALPVRWSTGADVATPALDALYDTTMRGDAWTPVVKGDGVAAALDAARANGARVVSAAYGSAWQAHATMEPMNCTASVEGDRCNLWAPTQGQTMCVVRVSEALGIPKDNVAVNRTLLGGGFGRRLIADYAVQAALISRAVGRPVKLVWTREEDFHRDSYRPAFRQSMTASLDANGIPVAMLQRLVAPTIASPVYIGLPKPFAFPQADPSCIEGLTDEAYPYTVARRQFDVHIIDVPVPTMVWRTTGYGPNVFASESFVDELAHAAGIDPLAYRLALLKGSPHEARAVPVLRKLAELAKLDAPRPRGRGVGIALAYCFQTYLAQAVEVSLHGDTLDLHHVTTVLDGGYVLDPDITRANIEGGINWGLTHALASEITFAHGRSTATNFDGFHLLALPEAPPTTFAFIDSGADPGGLGEVGPVPTAAALANAIFAASGRRVRTLPLARHGIRTRYAKQFA